MNYDILRSSWLKCETSCFQADSAQKQQYTNHRKNPAAILHHSERIAIVCRKKIKNFEAANRLVVVRRQQSRNTA